MTNSNKMDSSRELFKTMEILPIYDHYIFSLLLCVVNSEHLFTKNLEIHNHNTRSALLTLLLFTFQWSNARFLNHMDIEMVT